MIKNTLKYVKLSSLDTVKKGSSTGFLLSTLKRIQRTKNLEVKKFLFGVKERFFLATSSKTNTTILSNISKSLLTFEGTARKIA